MLSKQTAHYGTVSAAPQVGGTSDGGTWLIGSFPVLGWATCTWVMPSREGDVHKVWEAGGILGHYDEAGHYVHHGALWRGWALCTSWALWRGWYGFYYVEGTFLFRWTTEIKWRPQASCFALFSFPVSSQNYSVIILTYTGWFSWMF